MTRAASLRLLKAYFRTRNRTNLKVLVHVYRYGLIHSHLIPDWVHIVMDVISEVPVNRQLTYQSKEKEQ